MLVKVKLSKKSSYGAKGDELMVTERSAQMMLKGEFIEPFQPEIKEEKAPVETKEDKEVIETKEKKRVRITKSPRL